jgi:hypothetical protein
MISRLGRFAAILETCSAEDSKGEVGTIDRSAQSALCAATESQAAWMNYPSACQILRVPLDPRWKGAQSDGIR